jgi:hypothetical protein
LKYAKRPRTLLLYVIIREISSITLFSILFELIVIALKKSDKASATLTDAQAEGFLQYIFPASARQFYLVKGFTTAIAALFASLTGRAFLKITGQREDVMLLTTHHSYPQ